MSLDQALKDLMHDSITLELASGDLDKWSKPMLFPPVTVACYISTMNVQTYSREGREVTSTIQAILAEPELVVTPDARLTMPDGSHPVIVEVLAAKDENGESYYLEIRA